MTSTKQSTRRALRADDEFSLGALWRIIVIRRSTVFRAIGIALALAFGVSLLMPRQYAATAQIEINPENAAALDLKDTPAAAEDYAVSLATQADVLQSDTLALQVARQLNLEKVDSQRAHFSFLETGFDDSIPLEQSAERRSRLLKKFHKNLAIQQVGGTRILEVRYLDRDPDLAASVANTLVDDYLEQYYQTRYRATRQASDWLGRQLEDLKSDLADSQQRLVDYQKRTGILGESETNNVVMAKLEELNKQLSAAEANRIVKQAVWELAKSGDPELISSVAGSSFLQGVSAGPNNSQLGLLPTLRAQEAQLKADIAQNSARLGPNFPKLVHVMKGARIGDRCNVGDHAFIESGVVLGDNVTVKNGVAIWDGVTAENNVFIGPNVVFTNDRNPRAQVKKTKEQFLPTRLCEGASLGANVTVICGITVGRYAFAGAGAVLTRNVPDHALVVGNPAHCIGYVCECGEKLSENLICGCGLKYAKENEHIVRVPF